MRRLNRDRRRSAGPLADATLTTALAVIPRGSSSDRSTSTPSLVELAWLVLLAVTSQVLGYLFITVSLPRLPAATGSILLFVQPIFTLVFSAILLAERPSPLQLAGVGLVLGGGGRGGGAGATPSGRLSRRPPAPVGGRQVDPRSLGVLGAR